MSKAIDARRAISIIDAARAAGWSEGRILDLLQVDPSTIRWWRGRPDAVPQARVRTRLLIMAAQVREERRSEKAGGGAR